MHIRDSDTLESLALETAAALLVHNLVPGPELALLERVLTAHRRHAERLDSLDMAEADRLARAAFNPEGHMRVLLPESGAVAKVAPDAPEETIRALDTLGEAVQNASGPGQKQCRKCGVVKPLERFTRHPHTADKHDNRCKDCVAAMRRAKQAGLNGHTAAQEGESSDQVSRSLAIACSNADKRLLALEPAILDRIANGPAITSVDIARWSRECHVPGSRVEVLVQALEARHDGNRYGAGSKPVLVSAGIGARVVS